MTDTSKYDPENPEWEPQSEIAMAAWCVVPSIDEWLGSAEDLEQAGDAESAAVLRAAVEKLREATTAVFELVERKAPLYAAAGFQEPL